MSTATTEPNRYVIGYALTPKKIKTFILPSLLTHATQHGLVFVPVDLSKPLIDQGPFDCILHKSYDSHQLHQFALQNPTVPIIDSPESIAKLSDRVSMLESVNRLNPSDFPDLKIESPKQVVVNESEDLKISMSDAKLQFPVIAKPVSAEGAADSHLLRLVFDDEGLKTLTTPIVIQELVNHGGVVFKVYVAGSYVRCVKRKSLPDVNDEVIKMKSLNGCLSFSQISNVNSSSYGKNCDGLGGLGDGVDIESFEMPPESFISKLGGALRKELGLNLFNFDLIRDGRDSSRYVVIDINYFPGFAKMPDFESVFTDFLLSVVEKKKNEDVPPPS